MASGINRWNVTDASEWGRILGLVPVPLFGHEKDASASLGSVLLDGQRSSFTFLAANNSHDIVEERPLEWSWSAFVNHEVIADRAKGWLLLRRWDSPDTIRRFRMPATPRAASQFFEIIQGDKPVAHADVILHLLRAFRAIRETVRDGDNGLESIRLFNTLILASKAVADGVISREAVADQATIGDVLVQLKKLPNAHQSLFQASGAADLLTNTKEITSSVLVSRFIDVEPQFQYTLEPNLLMRHASGQLYQEAHLAIDRAAAQRSLFPGLYEARTAAGPPARSDVRFTPVALARTLIQQALKASKDLLRRSVIEILDPACGSAVFLIQVVQELANQGFQGKVIIRGFDLSPISCVMARFCLEHCRQDANAGDMEMTYRIEEADALERDWGAPDIVLMNPPFIHLDRMSEGERAVVRQVLGNLVRGRTDKAMAFAWKAFQSIAPGGVVAAVLPAPLLETKAGEAWRQALADHAEFTLLGCFRGFGYFKGAKVEPAFLVIRKPEGPLPAPFPLKLIVASDGAEDDSLRALRQDIETATPDAGRFEVYQVPRADFLSRPSWAPRSKAYQAVIEGLENLDLPTVADLFDVRQGAKTGLNKAFIIQASVFNSYSARSKTYFRPVAATSTIRNGKLFASNYVFYPYNAAGLTLTTEDQVKHAVGDFYKRYLKPNEERLKQRTRIAEETWWQLTLERDCFLEPSPKLVCASFGFRGSFAYDDEGQYVVTQGHAWLKKTASLSEAEDQDEDAQVDFHASFLPWAYLALLNSTVVERIISLFCPPMQGGQYDLATRYVERMFLPDLADRDRLTVTAVIGLARIGRAMHAGKEYDLEQLNQLSARAYQIPLRDILPSQA